MWPQRWWRGRKPLFWLKKKKSRKAKPARVRQELWKGFSGEQLNKEGLARSLLPRRLRSFKPSLSSSGRGSTSCFRSLNSKRTCLNYFLMCSEYEKIRFLKEVSSHVRLGRFPKWLPHLLRLSCLIPCPPLPSDQKDPGALRSSFLASIPTEHPQKNLMNNPHDLLSSFESSSPGHLKRPQSFLRALMMKPY